MRGKGLPDDTMQYKSELNGKLQFSMEEDVSEEVTLISSKLPQFFSFQRNPSFVETNWRKKTNHQFVPCMYPIRIQGSTKTVLECRTSRPVNKDKSVIQMENSKSKQRSCSWPFIIHSQAKWHAKTSDHEISSSDLKDSKKEKPC